jgi:hypothetical protein
MKHRLTAALTVALGLLVLSGCASSKAEDEPFTTRFVGSPDDTWTAIHIALVELDYDVESENRFDGIIRASRGADGDKPAVVLNIDQVMRTNVVHIYVRVSGGPDGPALDRSQQEARANELLAIINGLLYK